VCLTPPWGLAGDGLGVESLRAMSIIERFLVQRHDDELRYIAARVWIKVLCFSVILSFFVGASYGRHDSSTGWRALIAELPAACQQEVKRISWGGAM
jgi:hypothetical protein